MADVDRALERLKREFVKVNLLQASLDALIVFLGLNLALFLVGMEISPRFSNTVVLAVVGLAVFFADLAYRAREYRLEIYEERNPELREILRTARDNPRPENLATRAMVQDLMKRLRKVTSDSIVPRRSVIQKILVVGALSFLTLLSGVTDFQLQDQGGTLIPDLGTGEGDGDEGPVLRNGSEVFGERTEIDASGLDIAFNITGEGEGGGGTNGSSSYFSGQGALEASGQRLQEDLLLAKRYSVAIKELGEQ